ncbi:MAG: mechanosensitive ion channel [Leptospiraceae bacterium]|nr:mechanosensitive ion channel [Leptospiraceae bacterium]
MPEGRSQTGQVLDIDSFEKLRRGIVEYFSASAQELLPRVLVTVIILFLILIFRYIFLRIANRRMRNQGSKLRWRTNSAYFSILAFLVIAFPVWLPSLRSIATVLGLFGAGILIVFKEVFLNLAAWFYIMIRRPFELGNRISITGISGDVLDIRLLEFAIMEVNPRNLGGQSTGRIVHLPNALLWTNPLSNASKEFSFNWNEIRVPVKSSSDWRRAEQILKDIASTTTEEINESDRRIKQSADQYAISFARLHPGVFLEFQSGAVVLTLRHLSEPRTRRMTVDAIWRKILERFGEAGIELDSNYVQPAPEPY